MISWVIRCHLFSLSVDHNLQAVIQEENLSLCNSVKELLDWKNLHWSFTSTTEQLCNFLFRNLMSLYKFLFFKMTRNLDNKVSFTTYHGHLFKIYQIVKDNFAYSEKILIAKFIASIRDISSVLCIYKNTKKYFLAWNTLRITCQFVTYIVHSRWRFALKAFGNPATPFMFNIGFSFYPDQCKFNPCNNIFQTNSIPLNTTMLLLSNAKIIQSNENSSASLQIKLYCLSP